VHLKGGEKMVESEFRRKERLGLTNFGCCDTGVETVMAMREELDLLKRALAEVDDALGFPASYPEGKTRGQIISGLQERIHQVQATKRFTHLDSESDIPF
jgi:hypothetical protein